MPTVYLDSSALVKLVVREAESDALVAWIATRPDRLTSALARVEVPRAVRAHGPAAVARARDVLRAVAVLRIDDPLLDAAADLDPLVLRSLDAIHLASARAVGADLEAIVTYDRRMSDAALGLGLTVVAPA